MVYTSYLTPSGTAVTTSSTPVAYNAATRTFTFAANKTMIAVYLFKLKAKDMTVLHVNI